MDRGNTKAFNLFKGSNLLKIPGNESASELNHIEEANNSFGEVLDLKYHSFKRNYLPCVLASVK